MKFRYRIAEFHGEPCYKRLPVYATERRGILMCGNGICNFIPVYRGDASKYIEITLFGDTQFTGRNLYPYIRLGPHNRCKSVDLRLFLINLKFCCVPLPIRVDAIVKAFANPAFLRHTHHNCIEFDISRTTQFLDFLLQRLLVLFHCYRFV